jgi:hypothetical protein
MRLTAAKLGIGPKNGADSLNRMRRQPGADRLQHDFQACGRMRIRHYRKLKELILIKNHELGKKHS